MKKKKNYHKRISQKDNLGTDFSINQPLNNKFHIKFFNTYRNQQSEEKPYKHLKRKIYEKDNMKNFYSDNFNTNKLNENDKNLIKVNVRNKLYNKIQLKKRFIPKDNDDVFTMNPIKTEHNYQTCRPLSEMNSSFERIFNPSNTLKENFPIKNISFKKRNNKAYTDSITDIFQNNVNANSKVQNISNKPNNGNFNSLSEAAKKNLGERYYFNSNYSQF